MRSRPDNRIAFVTTPYVDEVSKLGPRLADGYQSLKWHGRAPAERPQPEFRRASDRVHDEPRER